MTITTAAPLAPAEENNRKRAAWRPLAAAAAAGSVLLITGFGVWASLAAEATGVQAVDSGTLTLKLSDAGVATFSQDVANMAPGDVVNRYVTLTNSGTLAGKALSLKVASTGDAVLLTGAKAAKVTVANCAVAWAGGVCEPGAVTVIDPTVVGTLGAPASFANITGLASLGKLNLKVSVALPDTTETSVNGTLPTGTVQGAKATFNYTFAETQRDAATTE